jgi:2,4-dienoyl-CoA reductase-like NADH-dependent reductase (Old Yellow Enzyme family)
MVEATAVMRKGRITYGDMGLWDDKHIEPLAKIAAFIHSQGSVAGIQLAHAGRKASCDLPWNGGARINADAENGWETVAPSAIPFNETDPTPHALSEQEIEDVILAFETAAKRALKCGFQVIEIHSAHGYLLHEFLSPISNKRTDSYGGSLENRMKLLLQVAERLRGIIPEDRPLFVRISATDYVENGWDIQQSIVLAEALKQIGVDLIDASSGGMVPKATIPIGKGYQVPFARAIRDKAHIRTGAVGLITDIDQANDIITNGDADLVFLGRELLREPSWALKAQQELGGDPLWPIQYGYAVKRRAR